VCHRYSRHCSQFPKGRTFIRIDPPMLPSSCCQLGQGAAKEEGRACGWLVGFSKREREREGPLRAIILHTDLLIFSNYDTHATPPNQKIHWWKWNLVTVVGKTLSGWLGGWRQHSLHIRPAYVPHVVSSNYPTLAPFQPMLLWTKDKVECSVVARRSVY